MQIEIRHDFPCDPDTFWLCFEDEELADKMERLTKLDRTVQSEEEVEGILVRKVRVQTQVELPGPAASMLNMKTLYYDQETRTDAANHSLEWIIVPPAIPDKIKATGTVRVIPTDSGCARIVEGEVKVTIPMFGKRIESMVVDMLGKTYDASAKLRLKWLESRDGGTTEA